MKIKIFTLILILLSSSIMYSQDELSKVGTGMAQFLKLAVGGRGAALGDAYVAGANDVSALYWNPSGIQNINGYSFGLSRYQLFADIHLNFLGFVVPLGVNSRLGLHIIYLGSGDIEITTIDDPNGTGEFYNTSNTSVGLTFTRRLTERFSLGVTAKYLEEKIYNEKGSTFAFDVGSQFNTGIYGLKLGMALTNFGGRMKLDGPDLDIETENTNTGDSRLSGARLETEDWPIPLTYRLGMMMDILGPNSQISTNADHRVTLMADGNDPIDHYLRYNTGIEYEWKRVVSLRGGYKFNYDEATYTFGAGFNVNMGSQSMFQVDYAFGNYGLLGYVHQYSVMISF